MARADLRDRDAQMQLHALAAQHLGDVGVRVVGERAEQGVAEIDDVDPRRGDGSSRNSPAIVSWMRSASAPAVSTPVGPPPTTTKFSAPCSITPGRGRPPRTRR